jgi:2',3'-cyclic-nucleotide 2'-phosphodiesterase/3'-nucleotidase
MEYTGADISSCSLGNDVSGFRKEITIRDVIGTYIFPNTLVVKELTGKVLRQAIEKTAEFFTINDGEFTISPEFNTPKLQLYAYDMYDGIDYTLDISKPVGNRITSLTFNNKAVTDKDTYNVVMNNYRSSGGGDYYFIKECKIVNDTQTEVIELLLNYILKNKKIVIPHKDNITIVK